MATALNLDRFMHSEPLARALAVEQGLPITMIRSLLTDKVMTMTDLARVVGPRRTLERRLKLRQPLTTEESDRLARLFDILAVTEQMFGDKARAMDWLLGPKSSFDDRAPLDLLRTSAGAEAVNALLQRARHGMLA